MVYTFDQIATFQSEIVFSYASRRVDYPLIDIFLREKAFKVVVGPVDIEFCQDYRKAWPEESLKQFGTYQFWRKNEFTTDF